MRIIKNEKTSEIVGLCFGDGSLTRRKSGKNKGSLRFQLRGHITEDKEHYDSYIKPMFKETIGEVPTITEKGKNQSHGISTGKISTCMYLSLLGIPIGVKRELKIPSWIIKSKENVKGFLRGFLDTDGTIYCQKNYSLKNNGKHTQIRLKLTTTSKTLAKEMKLILDNFEIKNLLKVQKKKRSNERVSYSVETCGGNNINRWFKLIGSNNPKHITKYLI